MYEIQLHIELIIQRSRRDDEGFMTDNKKAARGIIEYLSRVGLFIEPEEDIELLKVA